MSEYKSCTITLNRACNLRCWFCYAKDTNFAISKDMDSKTFGLIKSFIESAQIKRATLIGGEPTVFSKTLDFVLELKKIVDKITFVTNGIAFDSKELCKKYIDSGVKFFSVSIKAPNSEEYKEITGFDCFNKAVSGINNLIDCGARVSVSFVVTEKNVGSIKEMVTNIKRLTKCKNFFFSFCRNFNADGRSNKEFINSNNPIKTVREFEKVVPWLKANVERFVYAIGDPLCAFSEGFIKDNLNDFSTPCYVHTGSILTFDPEGYLIPCNTIHQIKIGKIGDDFTTFEDFIKYRETDNYKAVYKKLRGVPDLSCLKCELFKQCQGRCVCNWTNYNFAELKQMIDNYNRGLK